MEAERWKRINEIFSNWLEQGSDTQADYLNEVCRGDDSLRKEVDLLIDAHLESENFIKTSVFDEALGAIASSITPENLIGRVVSHYRIVQSIAAGGMGEVYLAEDTQLDRKVALKILPSDVALDRERMRRFVREAKAASAIDHPNIVHVYEINASDGFQFIAMQYVEGQTLRSLLIGKPLTIKEFLNYAIPLTEAISEAHARGITHRDLKPANVMISNKNQLKLLDFGIARMRKKSGDVAMTMSSTKSGAVLGTAGYMSPEQALGKKIDHRTDIFSMGILFYEMVTGRQPFTGENASETIDKIINSQPDAMINLNHLVPKELEQIVRKCLEKNPNNRYQSSSELLGDLKSLDHDLSSGSQLSHSINNQPAKRKILIPAALLLFAIVALFIYSQSIKESEIRSIAVLPFKNVNVEKEYLSDGIANSIINNISTIRGIRVMSRGTVFGYKNRDNDPRQVGKELDVDAVVTGKLLQQGKSLTIMVDFVDTRDGRLIWSHEYKRNLNDVVTLQSEISKEISNQLRIKLTK